MILLLDHQIIKHSTNGVVSRVHLLKDIGYPLGPNRIRRLFKLIGHETIYLNKNLTKNTLREFIHPYLLWELKITQANQV